MPKKSQATQVGERMAQRMSRLSDKIKETNAEPFGTTQLSRSEFRKRAMTDEAFRMSMARQMGPGNFLQLMNEDDNASTPPAP